MLKKHFDNNSQDGYHTVYRMRIVAALLRFTAAVFRQHSLLPGKSTQRFCNDESLPVSSGRKLKDSNCSGHLFSRSSGLYIIRCLFALIIVLCLNSCEWVLPETDSPRYVITSPEVAEIMYILQGTENVVGVTDEVDYPPAYQEITKVGSFGLVSIEKVLNVNPTLVLTSGLEQQKLSSELQKLGISTLVVYPYAVDDMLHSIEVIAEEIGIPGRGRTVRDSLEALFAEYSADTTVKREAKPRVYVEIYGNPIMSVSNQSFIGELLDLAGGHNIFEKLPRDYSRVKQEDVINADPQVIIVTYPGVNAADIKNRRGWGSLTACIENRIYTVDDIDPDLLVRAGPRSVEGLKLLRGKFSFLHD